MDEINWIKIPAGFCSIGTSKEEIIKTIEFWSERLLHTSYTIEKFTKWLMKEYPETNQYISSFWISKYPITNAQYREFLKEKIEIKIPESIVQNYPNDHPVWGVSFEDAKKFTTWLSGEISYCVRLPKEFEWEYAAKANTKNEYPYGHSFDPTKANTFESNICKTTPVDFYKNFPSFFGVCDLAGNVEEWVDDYYRPYPGGVYISDDLTDILGRNYPILRGGSFARGGDLSRSARRHGPFPSDEFRYTGFRIVHDGLEK